MRSSPIEAGAMPVLRAQRLAGETFAPFGQVIGFDPACAMPVNDGRALRSDSSMHLTPGDARTMPAIAFFRARADHLPFDLTLFERHPFSSQTFMALSVARFLIVVAPTLPDGAPDAASAQAFIGSPGQGVTYASNVWHAPITALDHDGDFLMMMWERGIEEDCIIHPLASPLRITA